MEDLSIGFAALSGPIRLLVALGIGLLIGLEREWRWRQMDDKTGEHAGLRTFGLIGLMGGLTGLLQPSIGGWIVPGALLALAGLFIAQRRKEAPAEPFEDMTTLVAALVAALLGTLS